MEPTPKTPSPTAPTAPTFDLTPKELKAARLLVEDCFRSIGGKRPSDLEAEEFTWTEAQVLMKFGYSDREAAGLFGSLHVKGFIQVEPKRNAKAPTETFVTTAGWKWMDTIWDEIEPEELGSKFKYSITGPLSDPHVSEIDQEQALIYLHRLIVDIENGQGSELKLSYVSTGGEPYLITIEQVAR